MKKALYLFLSILRVICIPVAAQAGFKTDKDEEIIQKFKTIFGQEANIVIKKIYNSNHCVLYATSVNGSKVGWYLVENDTIRKFDAQKDNYIFVRTDKISPELEALMCTKADDQLIPVYVIVDDIDFLKADLLFAEKYPRAQAYKQMDECNEKLTVSQRQELISCQRKLYSDLYSEKNNSVINRCLEKGGKSVFVSHYSPLNILELKKSDILEISKNNDVISISPYVDLLGEDTVVGSAQTIQADYVRDTLGFDGTGVKIGQFESGVPDTGNSELNSGCVVSRRYSANVTTHATMVATILVGDTYGIARGATLYSTYRNNTTFYEEIEWLVSQGVDVINMSYQIDNGYGDYDIYSQWIDHLAKVDSVHFVIAAGNNGNDDYITVPGMAYNEITVGAFDNAGTPTNHADDSVYGFSCAWEDDLYAEKPDLLAPGKNINFPNLGVPPDEGTSYSAPMVAAVVAQMIDINSTLATKQVLMKAILMASAFRRMGGFEGITPDTPYIDDIQGAGKLDSKNARYIVANNRFITPTINAGDYNKTFSVNASSSQIRVALTWLKQNSITGSHTDPGNLTQIPLADFDLVVKDPYGNEVGHSMSWSNNAEIVEFDPTVSGTYIIEVQYIAGTALTEKIALAWW